MLTLSANRNSNWEIALKACGFQQSGYETVYCGKTGQMLPAKVYAGVVYMQRLRHMVIDKAHARALG